MSLEHFEEPISHIAWLLAETGGNTVRIPVEYAGGRLDARVPLPEGVHSVHFQPAPEHGCVVYNLRLLSDRGLLPSDNLDGVRLGLFDLCPTPGALLKATLEQELRWVEVVADITPFDDAMSYELFGIISRTVREGGDQSDLLQALQGENDNLLMEVNKLANRLQKQQRSAETDLRTLQQEKDHLERLYQGIIRSTVWRLTKPLRMVVDFLKWFMQRMPVLRSLYQLVVSLRRIGVRGTLRKIRARVNNRRHLKKYIRENVLSDADRLAQQNTAFEQNIKFSILVPLYNTPIHFLKEMIQSVQDQTYANWELCLADGSDDGKTKVESVCRALARQDERIRYQKLEGNLGISGNSNKCIEMATGDYIGLFDHDDLLHPSLLFEMMGAIQEQEADFLYTDEMTFSGNITNPITLHFKPDFLIDNLRANNYICHFSCFRRDLLERAGPFRSECDGSQDYDIILRLTEQAQKIVHIPKLLYYWRSHPNSVAANIEAKPYCITAAKRAIADHLERVGLKGEVVVAPGMVSIYRIIYEIPDRPLISILIPNKDHAADLRRCIHSILSLSTYSNWEIIVCENNSTNPSTFAYYRELEKDPRIRVVQWEREFNYSAINNYMAAEAVGEYLLLLNNDTRVISPQWIEELLMFAQRPDVGAVGAKLYYPDDTIQHAGVVVGLAGSAGHVQLGCPRADLGYMGKLKYAQNYSAVTAACLMVSREDFLAAGGFDEDLAVAYNDVDFCLKLQELGRSNVFTPYAELYHYESLSRGLDVNVEENFRWEREQALFQQRWRHVLNKGDPCFNTNLLTHHFKHMIEAH